MTKCTYAPFTPTKHVKINQVLKLKKRDKDNMNTGLYRGFKLTLTRLFCNLSSKQLLSRKQSLTKRFLNMWKLWCEWSFSFFQAESPKLVTEWENLNLSDKCRFSRDVPSKGEKKPLSLLAGNERRASHLDWWASRLERREFHLKWRASGSEKKL